MTGPALALAEPPRRGLGDVSSHLVDFVITTFDVDANVLDEKLPDGITAERVTLSDGRERGLVSAVTFLNTRFFVGFAPFVKLTAHQTNYRAYVRRGEERAVFFFATTLATPFVFVPRVLWRMPWARSRASHTARWTDGRLDELSWDATSELGRESLRLRGTGEKMGVLDGFADVSRSHDILTHPLVGYLRRRGGPVVTYSVWHEPLEMERASAELARFEPWERLDLVQPEQPPHSVLVQSLTHYLVFLPPRRVK